MHSVKAMMRRLGVVLMFLLAPVVGRAGCTSITVTALAFGNYTGAAISSAATVTVNCSNGFAYTIGLDTGYSNNTSARTMLSGSNPLSYGLYKDAAHTNNWGDNNGVDTLNGTGTGANQTVTIYGRVPAGQLAAPGSYSESPSLMIVYLYNQNLYVTVNITAAVVANCTVSASAMTFGNYTGTLINNTSVVTVTCTNTTTFNIGLNAGTATGATVTTRKMTGPASVTLNYILFRDSARTQNWGNTVGTDTLLAQGNGTAVGYGVFGQLPAGQYVRPGAYADTIIATITY